jgi:hypothetical protein
MSFDEEFDDLLSVDSNNILTQGYNWYCQSFGWVDSAFVGGFQDWGIAIQYYLPQYFSITSGIVTMIGHVAPQPDTLADFHSQAYANNAQGYVGSTLPTSNGFYAEARIAGAGDADLVNAFWFVDLRALTGANTSRYVEVDIPELTQSQQTANINVIEWLAPSTPNWALGPGDGDTADSSFHVWGVLFVPASRNGGIGFLKFFKDGVQVSNTVNVPSSGAVSEVNNMLLHLILQTNSNNNDSPLQVDYVRVWQMTARG